MVRFESDHGRMTEAGLNLIQQALSIYDSDLQLVVSNRPFREMFDLPDHLVCPGAHFEDTIRYLAQRGEYGALDDTEEFVAAKVKQARAFEQHYMERERANGRMISVEGSPLPQGGWVTVYTDITSIKRQEALLRTRSAELSDQLLDHAERLAKTNRELAATNAALGEAGRQLVEMEARTRTVTEMMPAHIAHVGPNACYTYSNKRLNQVMGHPPVKIVGEFIGDVLGAEIYETIQPNLNRALGGEASVFEFTVGSSGRRVRAFFTPDFGPGQNVNGVYIMSMDITEEAQARVALAQAAKRELAAQLTSGLAHDFANLLTIILGLQGRLGKLVDNTQCAELVEATKAVARRGGTLLDRIGAISGPRVLNNAPTNLNDMLNNLRLIASPSLPEPIVLKLQTEGVEQPVMLDSGGLEDALLNLVLNARDAIGSGPGEIVLSAKPKGDTWLELCVSDTGPGFSPRALKMALQPFYTTKGQEGSGLGLTMVYDLIKLAGGQMALENTDKGARVSLRLPLRWAESAAAAEPKLVLLVDDSDAVRETVRETLVALDHKVIEASTF